MQPNWKPYYTKCRQEIHLAWGQLRDWAYAHRWKGGLIVTLFLLISCKDIQLSLDLNSSVAVRPAFSAQPISWKSSPGEDLEIDWSSLLESNSKKKSSDNREEKIPAVAPSPTVAKKLDRTRLNAKQRRQMAYVDRFAKVARMEMEKFGIPASITLAQGLLESSAGKSVLAHKHNNHFGIKCFHRNCSPDHCFNYADDSPKDRFRSYTTAWESFRAHSNFLMRDRYKKCRSYGAKDYKRWAKGLAEAGYATDPAYGEKLIRLIESLELYEYDR
jgi:flagellum-specific peptidoglycan hydrolase FlgJ